MGRARPFCPRSRRAVIRSVSRKLDCRAVPLADGRGSRYRRQDLQPDFSFHGARKPRRERTDGGARVEGLRRQSRNFWQLVLQRGTRVVSRPRRQGGLPRRHRRTGG